MTTTPSTGPAVNRRTVLAGAAAVGAGAVAAGALAACGGDDPPATSNSNNQPVTVSVAGIPVGGGKVFTAQNIVVTQPTEGTYKAFNAACTHQGCTVSGVENSLIQCPCHQSIFSADDGSVKRGPATAPLIAKTATLSGQNLTVS